MSKIKKASAQILIVEDSTTNILLLTSILDEEGFSDIVSVNDGKQAFKQMSKQKPNLVLLDINIPNKMNGIKVLELIKNDPQLRDVPVIIISAMNDEKFISKGLELGALEYLTKPLNIDRFITLLHGLFE